MEAAKKRCPPKSYVEALENRVVRVEKYLRDHCPDTDLTQELGLPFDKETWLAQGVDKLDSPCPPRRTTLPAVQPLPLDKTDDPDHSDEELVGRHSLEHHIKKMTVDPGQPRFFGKSSTIMFVQSAIDLKHGINKNDEVNNKIGIDKLPSKRPEFWKPHPWVLETLEHETRHIYFPEKDLMESLIDLYFTRSGLYLPIFHRPTFERDVRVGLHIHDQGFGSVVLLVCALGARFSNDPRVLLEGIKDQHSAGWKWFRQVHWVRRSLLVPPRLSDLQIASLTAIFLHGSSTPQSSWTAIGMGIRLAQDVGAHRRKVYGSVPTVEEELWKRAFWVLVTLDRFISSNLGRSCAIHDEDFDLDLPVECDDEYWINEEDPKLAFKQPPGKPSIVAYFNCHLRLNMIHAFALRTIYSINKSKVLLGFVGHQWEKRIVAELDSALSKWMDSVPSHLRWDPDQENLRPSSLHTFSSQIDVPLLRIVISLH
ncbi:hypothetical protein EW026_g2466 [Hermanssonia centrifuga]|uniref:Xylanolytic transcriptional activator regulatory domain-containing protein n=1 Tax=Hermanssonia centrifuga TaxID=98765 RepID=A0A4S4KN88_9APHY|nr:hypothetical protein EW026_g2466 [Hermanssonia centrifuga]